MLNTISRLVTPLLSVILLCSMANTVSANTDIELALTAGENGAVEISLTNTSATPLSLLRWETAFESELSDDVFEITPVGHGVEIFKRAVFTGRMFRRQAPRSSDFLTINPGVSLSTTIHLENYYDIPSNGEYRVQYIGGALMSDSNTNRDTRNKEDTAVSELRAVSLRSNAVSISLQRSGYPTRAQIPNYNQCSTFQRNVILAANDAAESMTVESRSSLEGLSASDRRSSPRYSEWFGAYTDSRFQRVVNTFQSIENALSIEVMTYDCSCDIEGVYAYVYPNVPYEIFLCPVFWETTLLGAGSQAGTIVHEVSHFTVVAGTDDHVYGQTLSANLADSDPDTAINNADNITFFAENDPVIPLRGEIDDPANTDINLVLDTPTTGSVTIDDRVLYRVAGTDLITLQTLSGDVDLQVHSDSDRTTLICQSNLLELADEVCAISTVGLVYISVVGYETSNYVITARAAESTSTTGEVIDLALNEPVTADVVEGRYDVYQVTNAGSISVTTNSGDADLFVFSELNFTQEFLVCQSAEDFTVNPIEVCPVPQGETLYAVVAGYLTSNYTIEARNVDNSGVDISPLSVGESSEGTLVSGQFLLFEVTNARRVVLESLSGNADLGVFSDREFRNSVCVSQNTSDVSALDVCEFELNTAYIYVLGVSDASFRLTVDDDADVSPESTDGSTPLDGGGSSGGGGALGLAAVLSLGVIALRRKEKQFVRL